MSWYDTIKDKINDKYSENWVYKGITISIRVYLFEQTYSDNLKYIYCSTTFSMNNINYEFKFNIYVEKLKMELEDFEKEFYKKIRTIKKQIQSCIDAIKE